MYYINKYKKFSFFALLAGAIYISSCTKLDVKPKSALTPDIFPTTPSQLVAATGPIYTSFRTAPGREYWMVQNLSADENVLVARGGNWYDGAVYSSINLHTMNADNGMLATCWAWGFKTISQCKPGIIFIQFST